MADISTPTPTCPCGDLDGQLAALESALGRMADIADRLVFRLTIDLLRQLSLSFRRMLLVVMTVELDDTLLAGVRAFLPVHPDAHVHPRALLAVRQHYGHRFEQDDDSFWPHRTQRGFRGAVYVPS